MLIDLGEHLVARPLRVGQLALQLVDRRQLVGLLGLQLLAALHHLEQRILQAGLATLQRLQFVLQLGELLGVDRPRREHRPVPVLALTHRVDLGLELRDLGVQVLERDPHDASRSLASRCSAWVRSKLLLLGQVAGSVFDPAQLGVELGQFEQRTLLDDFSFHDSFLSTFHGSVRMADTRTGSESPKWLRSRSAAWSHHGNSLAQCATSISATSDARRCSSAGWCRRSAVT